MTTKVSQKSLDLVNEMIFNLESKIDQLRRDWQDADIDDDAVAKVDVTAEMLKLEEQCDALVELAEASGVEL